jgi:hypothetical protein
MVIDKPSPGGCSNTCCGGGLDVDELARLVEAGVVSVPDDPEAPDGPRVLSESDLLDEAVPFKMSRVEALEWELWAGAEQDEAEKTMLELKGPGWVFLPPGAELAASLEQVRPRTESPMALIELMKAAARLTSWSQAITMSAMASFYRQRQAQAGEIPRPSELDSRGRPVDPERSWAAEIAAALKLSPDTVGAHIETALRLTGVLTATHAALKCGSITLSKAIAICDATRLLTDSQARAVEAHVLKLAPSQSHANLRRSLRTQVAHYDARNEADRHRKARTERDVRIVPLPDGMAGLWVVHTAEKIQQMWIVIQAMADLANDPPTHRPTPHPIPAPPSTTPRAQARLAVKARPPTKPLPLTTLNVTARPLLPATTVHPKTPPVLPIAQSTKTPVTLLPTTLHAKTPVAAEAASPNTTRSPAMPMPDQRPQLHGRTLPATRSPTRTLPPAMCGVLPNGHTRRNRRLLPNGHTRRNRKLLASRDARWGSGGPMWLGTCSSTCSTTESTGSAGDCPTSTGGDRTSKYSYRSTPCSDSTTTPANSPATAPSPPKWHDGSPRTAPRDASSPTPPTAQY